MLVEAAPPGRPTRRERVRLETRGAMSPWFGWATVGIDGIAPLARAAGLRCAEVLDLRRALVRPAGAPAMTAPPPGPFRPGFWRSPLRGPRLTAILGLTLLVLVAIVA